MWSITGYARRFISSSPADWPNRLLAGTCGRGPRDEQGQLRYAGQQRHASCNKLCPADLLTSGGGQVLFRKRDVGEGRRAVSYSKTICRMQQAVSADMLGSGGGQVLVGNKCDMDEGKRAVPYSKGQALADEFGIQFFETSAKSNVNVDEACSRPHN